MGFQQHFGVHFLPFTRVGNLVNGIPAAVFTIHQGCDPGEWDSSIVSCYFLLPFTRVWNLVNGIPVTIFTIHHGWDPGEWDFSNVFLLLITIHQGVEPGEWDSNDDFLPFTRFGTLVNGIPVMFFYHSPGLGPW